MYDCILACSPLCALTGIDWRFFFVSFYSIKAIVQQGHADFFLVAPYNFFSPSICLTLTEYRWKNMGRAHLCSCIWYKQMHTWRSINHIHGVCFETKNNLNWFNVLKIKKENARVGDDKTKYLIRMTFSPKYGGNNNHKCVCVLLRICSHMF